MLRKARQLYWGAGEVRHLGKTDKMTLNTSKYIKEKNSNIQVFNQSQKAEKQKGLKDKTRDAHRQQQ